MGFAEELGADAAAAFFAAAIEVFFACQTDFFAHFHYMRWGHDGLSTNGGGEGAGRSTGNIDDLLRDGWEFGWLAVSAEGSHIVARFSFALTRGFENRADAGLSCTPG